MTDSTRNADLDRVEEIAAPGRRRWMSWAFLAAGVAFAGFIAMFSLDGAPLFSRAFFMQNILTLLVLLPAALGFWRAWLGAAGFAVLAIAGCIAFRTWSSAPMFALFTLPPLMIAGMHVLATSRLSGQPRSTRAT